jgi:hypothetical protein
MTTGGAAEGRSEGPHPPRSRCRTQPLGLESEAERSGRDFGSPSSKFENVAGARETSFSSALSDGRQSRSELTPRNRGKTFGKQDLDAAVGAEQVVGHFVSRAGMRTKGSPARGRSVTDLAIAALRPLGLWGFTVQNVPSTPARFPPGKWLLPRKGEPVDTSVPGPMRPYRIVVSALGAVPAKGTPARRPRPENGDWLFSHRRGCGEMNGIDIGWA